VLRELFRNLGADRRASITIEGHTSSEGSDACNLRLSERRAQAVVADLTRRGLASQRVRAGGAGESRPIASNADENGRSMNRRVEVTCR
jgi:OOP family OmpA-OmpF porin